MKIVLLNNPNSGRGRGAAIADGLAGSLVDAGHEVTRVHASRETANGEFLSELRSHRLLVVAGGDGTLHHALPEAIASGIAVYHFPMGTENLFTREFGMTREVRQLVRAIDAWRVRVCDAGECDGKPFALMTSVGFDACVVERVAAARRAGVKRIDYVRCAMRELASPRVPRVSVRVDGRAVVDDAPGLLIVANCQQYAARLNPAVGADMSDGLLDMVFLPHRTSIGVVGWLGAIAAGMHVHMTGVVCARGRTIGVDVDGAAPMQVDGEAAGAVPRRAGGGYGLEFRVLPGVLNVLIPQPVV